MCQPSAPTIEGVEGAFDDKTLLRGLGAKPPYIKALFFKIKSIDFLWVSYGFPISFL